jgi:GlcNAc-PI de-N-acetylase
MKVADFLHAVGSMPLATLRDLTAGEPFMILSRHPDDESLGSGGLIAAACAQQQRVDVVLLTDGAGFHPNSQLYPPDHLVKLRREDSERQGICWDCRRTDRPAWNIPTLVYPLQGTSLTRPQVASKV